MVRDRERLWRALNPPPEHYDVRDTAGYGLVAAHRALRGLFAEDRWELGLCEGRDLVLLEIARLDGRGTPKQIRASLGMSGGSLSTVLARSVAAGYVVREADPRDGRTFRLGLTGTGQASARMAAIMWRDADRALERALSPEEVGSLRGLLRGARSSWRAAAGLRGGPWLR